MGLFSRISACYHECQSQENVNRLSEKGRPTEEVNPAAGAELSNQRTHFPLRICRFTNTQCRQPANLEHRLGHIRAGFVSR